MVFRTDDPGFTANETCVSSVSLESGATKIAFELPKPGDFPEPQNVRAEHDAGRIAVYFNPWVKNPGTENEDPPPEYMVYARDGDVFKNGIEIHLAGN